MAVAFLQFGFVVERVHLRGAAGHEQPDDRFGFRGEVRRLFGRAQCAVTTPQMGERQRAATQAGLAEKLTTGEGKQRISHVHGPKKIKYKSGGRSIDVKELIQAEQRLTKISDGDPLFP